MHNIKKINHNTKLSLTLGVLAGVIALGVKLKLVEK